MGSRTTRGRGPGSSGGETSRSGLLLGGVLNGDVRSLMFRGVLGTSCVISVTARAIGLLAIFGFSDRLTGGGGALKVMDESLLISPDLRGGGGEGGRDGDSLGDFASIMGVCGLLGIL